MAYHTTLYNLQKIVIYYKTIRTLMRKIAPKHTRQRLGGVYGEKARNELFSCDNTNISRYFYYSLVENRHKQSVPIINVKRY